MADLLTAAVLSVLVALPGPWEPEGSAEPPAERQARLETIASSIGVVANEGAPGWRWSDRELAAALVAVTYPESQRFHRDVHSGARRGDRGRAACLAQVHRQLAITGVEWRASMGTDLDATTMCMRLGARVLGQSARCVARGAELDARQVARLMAAYGTGRSCSPSLPFARDRGQHWRRIDRRLEELLEPARSALV